MNLSQVKTTHCKSPTCRIKDGRIMPTSHWVSPPRQTGITSDTPIDVFERHYHDTCAVCRRNSGELGKHDYANESRINRI